MHNLNESRRKGRRLFKKARVAHSSFSTAYVTRSWPLVRLAFGERLLAKCSRTVALDRRKRPSFVSPRWTNRTTSFVCDLHLLRWNDVPLTSRTFCPKNCNIFSVLVIFKCITQIKQMITSLLLLNNFYLVMYRRVQKKKKATNYCIRFGHSLWSANQLPAQGVNCQRDVRGRKESPRTAIKKEEKKLKLEF